MSWPKYLAFSWISLILVLNSTVRNSARVSPSFPYSVIFNKPPCALQTAYAQEGSLDGRTRMATLCRHQAAASTEDLSLFSVSHLGVSRTWGSFTRPVSLQCERESLKQYHHHQALSGEPRHHVCSISICYSPAGQANYMEAQASERNGNDGAWKFFTLCSSDGWQDN